MNITYLRSFYIAAKFTSISKAAKYLHFTGPGLSMQLKSLENEIGVRLLDRSNRGVELTDAGKIVYEYACAIISLTDKMALDLKNFQNKKTNLRVCACKSISEEVLLSGIYAFKEAHLNIDITMETCNSRAVLKKLIEHDTNIGVVVGSDMPPNIVSTPIRHEKLILVGKKNIGKDRITLSELSSLPLILQEQGSGILSLISNALDKKNLALKDLNVLISLNSTELIKLSLKLGKGYSFLPESSVSSELKASVLRKVAIEDFSISFDYYAAFRDNYFLSEAEKKFVSFLVSNMQHLCR